MIIAGVDEAGRGALAGPVVAGAVILSPNFPQNILNDSKKLTAKQRQESFAQIKETCAWGVGIVSAEEVDALGIKKATNRAMQLAVESLPKKPEKLHIDGNDRFTFPIESQDFVKGDETHAEISAASIIAKVTRDSLMQELHEAFPDFGFHTNFGYGTKTHLLLLEKEIFTPHHRKSYEPLKTYVTQGRLF